MTPTPPESPSDALRLVLFGLAGSGKSALLAALGQVSKTQDALLGGKIEDRGNRLGSIAGGGGERSKDEITAYPIHFIPGKGAGDVEAVLVDSDGLAASNLLTRQRGLDEDSPEGSLAYEVGDADGLILVLDASTPPGQVEGQFSEFARFLETVQKARGARAEVAGMPVFLVLNKCDTLAKPGDSLVTWVERIEQRKRDLAERFKTFLADREEEKKAPPPEEPTEQTQQEELQAYTGTFGRIELHVWATAIRKPDLSGGKNGGHEPYGVAELFRQALAEGSEYQARCARAQRRLYVVSVGAVALVAILLVFIVGLFALHRNTQVTMLESRVRDFKFLDSTGSRPGLRASVDQLRSKKTRLEEIEANSYYSQLDPALPIFGIQTMREIRNNNVAPERLNLGLLGGFAALALILAIIGLYGLLAFTVTQRQREIGIRMALGAQRFDVLNLVVGQGMRLVLTGAFIGLLGSFALTRVLTSVLFKVEPTDPLTFVTVTLLLCVAALLACYIPARRATKVDPMVALRDQ